MTRPLEPHERAVLAISLAGIATGALRYGLRHGGDPGAPTFEIMLLGLGVAFVGAIALGLKSGFLGGPDD